MRPNVRVHWTTPASGTNVGGIPPGRAKLGTSWCPNRGYRDGVDRDDYSDRVVGYRDGSISVRRIKGDMPQRGFPGLSELHLENPGYLKNQLTRTKVNGVGAILKITGENRRAV